MKCTLLAVGIFIVGGLVPVAAQTFTPLYSFTKSTDGSGPSGSLIQGSDGRLYGTANFSGAYGYGTVFAINTNGTGLVTLHSFTNGTDGAKPRARLVQGSDGRLYGTTATGGGYGRGVIFALKIDGTSFTTLYSFDGYLNGGGPDSGLIQGSDGRLYGSTPYGDGANGGILFAIKTDGTGFTVLYGFSGYSDGSGPNGGLIQGSDGRLYGTTLQGGAGGGTLFAITINGTAFTVLHVFEGSDGFNPYGGVIQGSDGRLYGTTAAGGTNNYGLVYGINTDGTSLSTLYNFANTTDGAGAFAGLIQGSDSRLYGTTNAGGADLYGTVFAVKTNGTSFAALHAFTGGTDGSGPVAALVQGSDGRLYGATPAGGADGGGAIYAYAVVVAPAFTTNPASQIANTGQTVVFTAAASASPTYQWTFNGVAISGASGATLTLTNVTASSDGAYAVIAANAGGTVTSSSATLTVNTAPAFTVNPVSVTIASGRSAAFSVVASGVPAPTYQWYLGNAPISGATDPILLVQAAASANAGTYTCVATNSVTSTTSSPATLTVDTSGTAGYLSNISARGDVGLLSGDVGPGILFAGVGLGGSGNKTLLIRGGGPGLAYEFPTLFTSSDVVSTPRVALISADGTTLLAQNTVWGGTTTLMNAFTLTGAFAFQTGSADSALLNTVPVANYNVEVTTSNGSTVPGIGLVEVYDADTGTPTAHIINLSARDYVGVGGHILIGGFVIGGTDYETLLVRSVGPGLYDKFPASFTSTNVLAQPVVTIVKGSTAIYSNTGWGGDTTLTNAMATVGAYALNPLHQDSAMLVSLPPGNYTIEVSGVSGSAGQATVEFYDMP